MCSICNGIDGATHPWYIAASKNSMDILHEIDRLDNIPSYNKSQNRVQYHNIAARREKDFKK